MITKERINSWIRQAYDIACKHGFHDEHRSDEHWLMLIITEISEAIDADRKNRIAEVSDFNKRVPFNFKENFEKYIKDSQDDEIADIVIRCFDFMGVKGWQVDYSTTDTPVGIDEHPTFCETAYGWVRSIVEPELSVELFEALFKSIFHYCHEKGIDLEWHIDAKMRYNELRPFRNGKQY